MSTYKDSVRALLYMIAGHTLNPDAMDNVDKFLDAWCTYLEYEKVPAECLMPSYTRAMQIRTANKKSAKFSMEDLVEGWKSYSGDLAARKAASQPCSICNGDEYFVVYNFELGADERRDCVACIKNR